MSALREVPGVVFERPVSAFAPSPAEARGLERDQVRLLVAGREGVRHGRFAEIADHLRAGDLVVVNDSATVAGQLDARSDVRGRLVLHLAAPLDDGAWVVELRSAPDAAEPVLDGRPGERVLVPGAELRLEAAYPHEGSSPTGSGNRLWRASVTGDLDAAVAGHGRAIAYGYLDSRYPLSAYQSVFSRRPGSAEMASAARPFTQAVVTDLVSRGVAIAPITLHTGVSSQEAGEGPQPERYEVGEATARLTNAVRAGGGRVVAVGTTVTRALESSVADDGRVIASRGWTERVVTPDHPPRVVTGLVTGWHDPQASHLLLVEAVAGRALAQTAYDAAVAQGYLWHEFGDSALLLP
ncbi:queuosine biosynthesis protein [Marmoricola endophyticus]|uniref:Queuosine biosynthesis protein n=1 Tax=Marmoricola endophyticus TaxID=2040280 RepID=A0A917BGF1_9ACTN|nr:S-adenosylmethionine:tRNA ribosyltransferase-isomerase [Marmoricola endophyticus]GGF38125.1 queuosine biosynthesis protein [Marmoricola endophyticus]